MWTMYRLRIVVFGLLAVSISMTQQRKIPVSVLRTGEDKVGTLFVSALNEELARSTTLRPMSRGAGSDEGLRFYIELATIAVDDGHDTSAVSVVIEDMGLPSSFPVATKWYHKVVLVGPKTAGTVAQELVADIDASWCNHIKSSIGNCPKENSPRLIHDREMRCWRKIAIITLRCMVRRRTARGLKMGEGTVCVNVSGL
jgi:hypothetical protein